jgi:hypothetical protein
MERLFNITFYKNDGVIPFYYEIKEVEMWVGDFSVDIFARAESPGFILPVPCLSRFFANRPKAAPFISVR